MIVNHFSTYDGTAEEVLVEDWGKMEKMELLVEKPVRKGFMGYFVR